MCDPASEIAKVPEIRSIINEIIQTITKKKGFVVVGRDATTKILPDAEIKLVFDAEIIENVLSDILKRDFDVYDLVMEAKKVATIINTSNLSIEQVLAKILRHVYWYNFSNNNLLHPGAKRRAIENGSGNSQEESSIRSNIEPTVEELIEYENWQITNYVSDKAFIHVFSDLEKRYEFISNLLEFNQKYLENYEHIERNVLPRNRQDDLFRDAQNWRKNILNGPKRGAKFQISRLEELLKDLENEIDDFMKKIMKKILNKKIIMNNKFIINQNYYYILFCIYLVIIDQIEFFNQQFKNQQLELLIFHMNNNEVLQEMNNWEYAMKNDECGELIDNFKYIYNQNRYVRMSDTIRDDNLYFSDNELMMDDNSNDEKNIYLNKRNNPTKDFYSKYQVPGGGKKNNKSYDQCAKRETKEETDVEIYELDLVTIHQGFRVFSDDKECMFKCAIYFALIGNQIPKQVEASNNDEWFSVELKNLGKYDLMDSLKEFKSVIVEKINSKFRSIKSKDHKKKDNNKKRKLNQIYESDNHSIALSEDEIEISKVHSEEEIFNEISKLVDN
ncbi:hypothetical protein C2G38_2232701 [Gigaspora rosea]|uniref:(d)CMP kinase n=1 Tax=Gigaspora rosea TaxID=44941 RepID=A0A397TSU6_9GLOM|nr:hypothetical protein C2G38_2232701 [Gigaspora rosea]